MSLFDSTPKSPNPRQRFQCGWRDITTQDTPLYERIYALVRLIPSGHVATYGQVAGLVGGCTARMVGYALAALPYDTDVPWQRVINRMGKISPRSGGAGGALQRQLLEAEGVAFDQAGRVDFAAVGWPGPDWDWLLAHQTSEVSKTSEVY